MDEIDSRKQSHSSLDKNKMSSLTSKPLKRSQSSSTNDKTLSTIESSDSSAEIESSISHISSFDEKKPLLPHFNPDDQTEKLDEIFILTKEKLQPTLDALQGKKDELLSASKYLSDAPIANEYSTESRLHSPQFTSSVNADISYAAIKQKQYQQQTPSFNTDPNKKSKSGEKLRDEKDNTSAADVERNCFNQLQEKVSEAVSQIMKQAARIVHDKQTNNSVSTEKINAKESISTQALERATDNEDSQDSSTQNKSIPFTTEPNQHNKKSIESNPNEKLKSTRSITHPNDNVLPITTDISLMTNKSSETMKTKPFDKKKSQSTLCNLFVDF